MQELISPQSVCLRSAFRLRMLAQKGIVRCSCAFRLRRLARSACANLVSCALSSWCCVHSGNGELLRCLRTLGGSDCSGCDAVRVSIENGPSADFGCSESLSLPRAANFEHRKCILYELRAGRVAGVVQILNPLQTSDWQ